MPPVPISWLQVAAWIVNKKETEKLSKYKELEIEVSRMWESEDKNCASYN